MHFTALVLLPKPVLGTEHLDEMLGELLAPFDENLGIEPDPEYPGEMWNPRGKWDWWVLGGRWHGFFKLHDDNTPACRGVAYRGEPGAGGNHHNGGWDCTTRGNVATPNEDIVRRTHAVLAEGCWKEPDWLNDDRDEASRSEDRFSVWLTDFWQRMAPEQWVAIVEYHS